MLPLIKRAATFLDRVAIVDNDNQTKTQDAAKSTQRPCATTRSHTYTALLDGSAAVATALLNGRDDLCEARVAFLVPPSFDYAAVQWGIWRAGGLAVPLATMHPPAELAYTLDDADVSAVVVHPELRDRVTGLVRHRHLPLLTTTEALAAPAGRLPEVVPSRRAMMLYTSGTTSKPKGVVTTHANIAAQIESLVQAWEWSADDRILHVLPLHHIHGIINVLSCALWSGASCEFLPQFDAVAVWYRIASGELSLFMAVPTIYARLISAWEAASPSQQQRWSEGAKTLRLMVSGSAALPVSTLERWQQISGHTLLERYGMTEIGMALSNPLKGERRAGHVGIPLPGVEVRLADESGEDAPTGTPGEILVRGPSVFQEYWRREEATAAAFDAAGWFRTGDVAVLEEGSYRILGRNSVDIIKTGGYKVSALEIEEVLRTHPAISECAVVGVPDDEWGEVVACCVVPQQTGVVETAGELAIEPLRQWAKQHLAVYKVPQRLLVCESLPRNALGKVQKPALVEQFAQTS